MYLFKNFLFSSNNIFILFQLICLHIVGFDPIPYHFLCIYIKSITDSNSFEFIFLLVLSNLVDLLLDLILSVWIYFLD